MQAAVNPQTHNPMTTNVKMSAKGVDLFYGSFQALKNVDVDILENKVTAFIGPSGCGKSTFLRCLNRMNDLIDSCKITGSITLEGQDIYESGVDPVALRKRIGMVFQKPNPFPMTIYENITYGPKIHGIRNRAALDEIVERCLINSFLWDEVKDKLNTSGNALSGGQQQRLCIARTLAVDPDIILMDEPCSALDPIATMKIEELIAELKKTYTIAIVTHNMQQAQRSSDFTAFFMMGELIEYAPTTKIFTAPTQQKTDDYISGRFG